MILIEKMPAVEVAIETRRYVGWVERRDTHHLMSGNDGFRKMLNPSHGFYGMCRSERRHMREAKGLEAQRSSRASRLEVSQRLPPIFSTSE